MRNKHSKQTITEIKEDTETNGVRPFIRIYYDNKHYSRTLYDLGANTSCLSEEAFDQAKKSQCVGDKLKEKPNLQNANGQHMESLGYYYVTFTTLGRQLRGAFAVIKDLESEAILGCNIINKERMLYTPWDKTVRFIDPPKHRADTAWLTATIQVVKACKILPGEAALVKCRLVRHQEEAMAVGPGTSFIGEIAGVPMAAETNEFGSVMLYIPNKTDVDMDLTRRTQVGIIRRRITSHISITPLWHIS